MASHSVFPKHTTSSPPMSSRLPPITTLDVGSQCPDHSHKLQPLHVPTAHSGLELLRVATEVVASSPETTSALHLPPLQRTPSAPTSPSTRGFPPPPDTTEAVVPVKVYKKRGRKPTPGLTEEDRKQARLLKNRRTAEMSRRRKMQYLHDLQADCAGAKSKCAKLTAENARLRAELARCKRKLHEFTSHSGIALSEISGQYHATNDTESERETTGDE